MPQLIAEVRDDPETLGLLLHGSRAVGTHRPDSDYDLIRVVTEQAYAARKAAGHAAGAIGRRRRTEGGRPVPDPLANRVVCQRSRVVHADLRFGSHPLRSHR